MAGSGGLKKQGMKLRLILLISICVNLALAGAYFVSKRSTAVAKPQAAEPPSGKAVAKSERARRAQAGAAGDTNAFHWGSVESDDYREYIANLRAIGCPEETIRDIIIADVNKLYAGRIAALYPSPRDFKFWQSENRNNREERRDRERKRREVEEEKEALIKELLGIDYEDEMAKWDGRPDDDAWRLGFLTPEKQQAVEALQNKFRDMERALFNEIREAGGPPGPETRAKMAALRAQREAEMAQLLGPQDYQEYQLRNSNTARSMRDSLASFSPSEEEFRKIFEARNTFDEQFRFTRGGDDEAVREQRRLAQQQLDDQLRSVLGEERFAQYQLAQDDRYREAFEFAQRNNLPQETAKSLYDIRQTAEQQRRDLLNNQSIAPDQRSAALAQMADELKITLKATMTPEAYAQYLRDDGGWVNRFARTETSGRDGGRRDWGRFERNRGGGFGPPGRP
jgi:hypothetical protein